MIWALALAWACAQPPPAEPTPGPAVESGITYVLATGNPGAYRMSVTVKSDDTGCSSYADWWEVLRPDGTLLYRRVLAHSHVEEQPFTRSGGPIPVQGDEPLLVRVHRNDSGYFGAVQQGTVRDGFAPAADLPAGFAADLASADPQPSPCAW